MQRSGLFLLLLLSGAGQSSAQDAPFQMPNGGGRTFEGIENGTIVDGAGNAFVFQNGKMTPWVIDPNGPGSAISAEALSAAGNGVVGIETWCQTGMGCSILSKIDPTDPGAIDWQDYANQLQLPMRPDGYVMPVVDPWPWPEWHDPLLVACLESRPVYCKKYPEDDECQCPPSKR